MTLSPIRAAVSDHDAVQIIPPVPGGDVRQQGGASVPPCTVLTVPAPPSVNRLFKNLPGRGRAKTKEYRDWVLEAAVELRGQRCKRISGPVVLVISVERDNKAADIDNRVKAIADFLVQPGLRKDARVRGLIDDDSKVVGFCAAWAPRGNARRARAQIMILPAQHLFANFHPSADGATGGWFIDAPEGDEIGD